MDVPVGARRHESGSASFGISASAPTAGGLRGRDLRDHPDLTASNAAWGRAERRSGAGHYLWALPPSSSAGIPTCLPQRLLLGFSLVLLRRSLLLLWRFLLLWRSLLLRCSLLLRRSQLLLWFWASVLVVRWQPPRPSRLEVDFAPAASRWPGFLAKSRGPQLLLKHFHEQMPYGLFVSDLIEER
jgi:hypothetical protein